MNTKDWQYELSSGYAGYRNLKTGEWIRASEFLKRKKFEKMLSFTGISNLSQQEKNIMRGCEELGVSYPVEIAKKLENKDISPCIGRDDVRQCYMIDVTKIPKDIGTIEIRFN